MRRMLGACWLKVHERRGMGVSRKSEGGVWARGMSLQYQREVLWGVVKFVVVVLNAPGFVL